MHSGDPYEYILGMKVGIVNRAFVVDKVAQWIEDQGPTGRYVCVANVHMCMESVDSADFRSIVNGADLTVPDGFPLVCVQQLLGRADASQVRGQDLTNDLCRFAETQDVPVGLFGGSEQTLRQLKAALHKQYPGLRIVCAISPPFRPITPAEDEAYVREINASGAKILFVGLGCPKQEIWMAEHREELALVMLGVGAAFDFIGGAKKCAPTWLQRIGLEWLFRLGCEPRRLWKRYLKQNPRFIWHFTKGFVHRDGLRAHRRPG